MAGAWQGGHENGYYAPKRRIRVAYPLFAWPRSNYVAAMVYDEKRRGRGRGVDTWPRGARRKAHGVEAVGRSLIR